MESSGLHGSEGHRGDRRELSRRDGVPIFQGEIWPRKLVADDDSQVRDEAKDAELLLLPYDYLISPQIRDTLQEVSLKNSVLIFDEGHNIESPGMEAPCLCHTSERKEEFLVRREDLAL